MKKLILISCLLAMAITVHAKQNDLPKLSGPYLGQKPPGTTPEIFAPGSISTPDNNEFCASFSPDGTEFYFNRNMKIMVCSLKDGQWSLPEPVSFSFQDMEIYTGFPQKSSMI